MRCIGQVVGGSCVRCIGQVVGNVEELRMVFNLIDTSRKTGKTKNRDRVQANLAAAAAPC